MSSFAARLVAWHARHGRRDLPWQQVPTPYRVWVSEIMLQQTQVATVTGYFERFVERFPSAGALAAARLDDVLALWSGLGYYARARNLHRAARRIVDEHGGELPDDYDALVALPGIGRSTAGAILALAHGRRFAILDGNVKRVLVRRNAIERFAGERAVERELWSIAEALTPAKRVAEYTQAIMDLGATVCTRRRPACDECPVSQDCGARAAGLEQRLPVPRPKRARPTRRSVALLVEAPSGAVLLERRPESGVWGGLYSLPEPGAGQSAHAWCRERLGAPARDVATYAVLEHAFTHFDLELRVERARLERAPACAMDDERMLWYNPQQRSSIGLAAPITSLLERFFGEQQAATIT